MRRYTKKEIAAEYDCMESVKGPYPEGDKEVKAAIIAAEEPYNEEWTLETGEKKTLRMYATTRQDIIDRAYDILNGSGK